ncbi:MAG: hypothetical protein HY22_04560 [[Candidatus Thermochlorobacteriaceae] bacterium GBChlB]|nr:MAG: hypothetical protein HY22_04560 [[Candidatus Thermochlorobacteriaceae] bacterium GBChlB]
MKKIWILAAFLLISAAADAQNELDALRQSQPSFGVGARALGMGSAYTAIADDYSAMFFNPAGLGQIKRFEANLGFDFNQYRADASYINPTTSANITGNALNSAGLVIPFPTYRGSFTLALGYNRLRSFRATQEVNAFNQNGSVSDWFLSSFTPSFDNSGRIILNDAAALAFNQFLVSDQGGRYVNPLVNRGQVQQTSRLLEDGGGNAFSIAGSIEVAPALFLGATVNFTNSRYTYNRTLAERDVNNIYTEFSSLSLTDDILTETNGWNAKFGLLYRASDNIRLGITVETPTLLNLRDTYSTRLQTTYKRPPQGTTQTSFSNAFDGDFSYNLQTPVVFSAGITLEESFLTISAEASYRDWTQLSYSADGNALSDVNRRITADLTQAFGAAVGAELRLPTLPVRLRAGYSILQSPFRNKLSNPSQATNFDDARRTLSLGAGVLLQQTLSIDVAYLMTNQLFENRLYGASPIITESIRNNNLVLTASFRF